MRTAFQFCIHHRVVQLNAHFQYQILLQEELARRIACNAHYSIRAFAQSLSVSSGAMSQVLSGKRMPSVRVAKKILSGLNFSPEQTQRFWMSLSEAQSGRPLQRRNPHLRKLYQEFKSSTGSSSDLNQGSVLKLLIRPLATFEFDAESFRVIADWYHYVILELSLTEGFPKTNQRLPAWIAREIGITVTEATLAVQRLIGMGLLKSEKGKAGTLRKQKAYTATADHSKTSPAHRKRQRQILEKSIHSLENDPIEERSHTAMTMAINPERLPEAKRLIREFQAKLCELLESGPRKRVYELSVGLFPVQRKGDDE